MLRVGDVTFDTPLWVVSVEDAPAMDALQGSLAAGQTVALLGPSGAGKSTLINRLADSELAKTDCSHSSEPGCAVLAAVEEGRLDPDRLGSYRKLQAEAAYERRRVDPQARADYVAEWKTAMRTVKHHPKYKRQG